MDYSHSQGKYKSVLDIFRELNVRNIPDVPRMNIDQRSRMKDHNRGKWARMGLNYDLNDRFSFEVSTSGTLFDKRIPGYLILLVYEGTHYEKYRDNPRYHGCGLPGEF